MKRQTRTSSEVSSIFIHQPPPSQDQDWRQSLRRLQVSALSGSLGGEEAGLRMDDATSPVLAALHPGSPDVIQWCRAIHVRSPVLPPRGHPIVLHEEERIQGDSVSQQLP